jgi:phosphoribosylformylglycinamidine synthase
MYLARVHVTLKPTVNDPQGLAVLGGLKSLGFDSVQSVRIGKYMELKIDGSSRDLAQEHINQMCRQLLANMVIEDYSFELEETL